MIMYIAQCMDCSALIDWIDEQRDWDIVKRFILSYKAQGYLIIRADNLFLVKHKSRDCTCQRVTQLAMKF